MLHGTNLPKIYFSNVNLSTETLGVLGLTASIPNMLWNPNKKLVAQGTSPLPTGEKADLGLISKPDLHNGYMAKLLQLMETRTVQEANTAVVSPE